MEKFGKIDRNGRGCARQPSEAETSDDAKCSAFSLIKGPLTGTFLSPGASRWDGFGGFVLPIKD
uniref:Uncharacterized protein n=1 Tax=Timema cristinae TaxID=61476 RepID=A0A7R9GV44_TIMCR|nr:unnamed protein product [Timema cristinae]